MPARDSRLQFLVFAFATSVTLAGGAGVPAFALTIDDFSVGPIVVSRTGPAAATALQTGLDPNHILGGGRDIIVGQFGAGNQSLTIDAALGELRFTVASDLGYFELTYGTVAQPLNVDLTAGGADSFVIVFGAGSYTSLNFLRVFTATGEGTSGAGRLGTMLTPLPDGDILAKIPFSTLSGSPDLTSVQRIRLDFYRRPPLGAPVLKGFATVPEPASAALLLASLLGMLAVRRGRWERCVA